MTSHLKAIAALKSALAAAHEYEAECNERRRIARDGDPRDAHFAAADHAEALNLVTALTREVRIIGG